MNPFEAYLATALLGLAVTAVYGRVAVLFVRRRNERTTR